MLGYSQLRMFFSSGTAQTNGGGSRCIAMYSLESCRGEKRFSVFLADCHKDPDPLGRCLGSHHECGLVRSFI